MLPVPGRTILSRLAYLVIACVLPIWITAGFVVGHAYQYKRALVEQNLLQTARSISLATERDLAGMQAALRALATSPSLASGDMVAFHSQMREILRDYPGADIILADASGQQLVNSYQDFGVPLPKRNNPAMVQRIFATGRPQLSDLFRGAVTGRWLMATDVPVILGDKVAFDLSLTLPADHMAIMLSHQNLPADAVASILDSRGVVAARSRQSDVFTGQSATPALLQRLAEAAEGTVELRNLEGLQVMDGFRRSPNFGWVVVVGMPKASYFADLRNWLAWTVGGMTLLSALGLGLAAVIAGSITRAIRVLTVPAEALGHGGSVSVPRLGLREADALGEALLSAAHLLHRRQAERDAVEQTLIERTTLANRQYERLRSLNDIAALPRAGAAQQVTEALVLGSLHLGLPTGIVSRIESQRFTVQHYSSSADIKLHNGMVFDLGQTYCSLTYQNNDVVAIRQMSASPYAGHPCFHVFGLECYIGAPVLVQGRRYGTVSFSASQAYLREFDDGDREFMRLLARWVGVVLERQQVSDELARSNAELEQFAYIASHDLREPLRQVSSYVTLLERRYADRLDGESLEFIRYARDGAKRMDRLILDLLDYSSIGRDERPMELLQLGEVIGEAVRGLGLNIKAAEAQIIVPEDLPTLTGDRSELARLFRNLIGNAVKYHQCGRPPVVTISAHREEQYWVICVKDNGIGVETKYYDRIFGIFQRLHGHTEYEGTGIGLAACKKIVERHGGRVWVQSVLGEGSEFFVALPVIPETTALSWRMAGTAARVEARYW